MCVKSSRVDCYWTLQKYDESNILSGSELMRIGGAKNTIVDCLLRSARGSNDYSAHIQVDPMAAEIQKAMYYCLVDLSRILHENDYSDDYFMARDFRNNCFKTLATAVQDAFKSGDDNVTAG